ETIACACLNYWGLTPERYADERRACNDVERLAREGRWPLLLTPLDTSGEKPYEEFVGAGESATDCGLANLSALRHVPCAGATPRLLEDITAWVTEPDLAVAKDTFVNAISDVMTTFRHRETEQNLDQRL